MNFFNVIYNWLKDWCSSLGLNAIFVIFLSALLIAIAVTIIACALSVENRTSKSIVKVRDYLINNPFVTNENIVEFNRLMKKVPRTLRTKWQQYVVNRSKKPSDFFNEEDCIEKPFKTKGFSQALTIFKCVLIGLVSLSLIFSSCAISSNSFILALQECSLTPLILSVIGIIFIIILNAVHGKVRENMYFVFKDMTKLLDRAVTTFPEVVDYEILFTKKEIDAMIPELQEYLRQRAVHEQEQLEKAKENEVEHENYDFSSLGVDGSLVMERAMKECEYYLGNRRKALASIEQLQSEKDLLTKSYDEKNKTSQRKLRDINETLDRLREKLNSTTNKIVGNDIRRQQTEEIKKQQNIEREIEEDNNRYVAELKKVDDQINSKKQDIDNNRHYVEVAFTSEFKAYADKVYEKLYNLTADKVKDEVNNLTTENQTLKSQMEEKDVYIIEKNKLFDEKMDLLNKSQEQVDSLTAEIKNYEDYKNQVEAYLNQKDTESADNAQRLMSLSSENEQLRIELNEQEQRYKDLKKSKTIEVARCFDVNGNEFFYDEEGLPYYLNEKNKKTYYYTSQDVENGTVGKELPKTRQQMESVLSQVNSENTETENVEPTEKVVENYVDTELNDIPVSSIDDIKVEPVEQPKEQSSAVENVDKVANDENWRDFLSDLDDEEDEESTPIIVKNTENNNDWSYEKFWADADEDEQKTETTEKQEDLTFPQEDEKAKQEDIVEKQEPVKEEKQELMDNVGPQTDVVENKQVETEDKEKEVEGDDLLDEFPDLATSKPEDKKVESKAKTTNKKVASKSPKKQTVKATKSKKADNKKVVKNTESKPKAETKKTTKKAEAKKDTKPAKAVNGAKAETKKASAKSKTAKKDNAKEPTKKVEEIKPSNGDVNFDDFNKELTTALSKANTDAKKGK